MCVCVSIFFYLFCVPHSSGCGKVRRRERPSEGLGTDVRTVEAERRRRRAQIQRSQTAEVIHVTPSSLSGRKLKSLIAGGGCARDDRRKLYDLRQQAWCKVGSIASVKTCLRVRLLYIAAFVFTLARHIMRLIPAISWWSRDSKTWA